jgi:hypothetical protein
MRIQLMEQRSPRIVCYFLMETRVRVRGKEAGISCRRSTRWGGSWMVLEAESEVHISTSVRVTQVPSPFGLLLMLTGS